MHFTFFHLKDKNYCVSFVFICGLFHEVVYNSDCAYQMMGWLTKDN